MIAHRNAAAVEPVAIVGMGCRLPGGVTHPEDYWRLIRSGVHGITDVPADRWDVKRFYASDPGKPGKMYVKKGGFLETRLGAFDPLFFGITPREADCMDPQQRLSLQGTWEALEDAGIVPASLAGTSTGVFMGVFTTDNLLQQMGTLNRHRIGPHSAVGSTATIVSNRISYVLDLRGPSISIDTACSSSMVAIDLACQAIGAGRCDLAIAGGVNLIFRPEYAIAMCKGKFLAKDGFCKSFDARADGYGRGEGVGILILKPLQQALEDGDRIHAVIRATGANQDGRTNGITVPNAASQQALIREVCRNAGIALADVDYVEAHGTGTKIGDLTESTALGETFGAARLADDPLPIGSVKANIGHLEAASGVAGVIKAVLCLQHGEIPPIANLGTPNPEIPFDSLGLMLPRSATPKKLRFACVNSFGYGGTNAHAVLEKAPRQSTADAPPRPVYLLTVSARDADALVALAERHHQQASGLSGRDLYGYCRSAALRRSHFEHRLGLVFEHPEELAEQFGSFLRGESGDFICTGVAPAEDVRPVFVYTGMGPQWFAMGQALFQSSEAFRYEALRCDEAFRAVSSWSVIDEMLKSEGASRMHWTTVAQPANFVLQCALTALWKERGIEPAAVVGHSVGEVTAAYISGALTLREAALVSFHRSQIQSEAAGQGGMLATGLSAEQAQALLREFPDARVDIAAVNGPTSVTLSGDRTVLDRMAARLAAEGIFQRVLDVEVPYHSPYMDPLMENLAYVLETLQPSAPNLPLYSTVTGHRVEDPVHGAEYWCRNARQAVLFGPVIDALLRQGHRLFLEIGPHPVLGMSIRQCAQAAGAPVATVASLHRAKPERKTFERATAELFCRGGRVDWSTVYAAPGRYVPLPLYPWKNTIYWSESDASRRDRCPAPDHPLLGLATDGPERAWETRCAEEGLPFLPEHRVEDLVVMPGAAYVELGLAADRALHQRTGWALEDIRFFQALILDDAEETTLRASYAEVEREFRVHSRRGDEGPWQAHATGLVSNLAPPPSPPVDLAAMKERANHRPSAQAHYENMGRRKLQYGPSFQGVKELWRADTEVLARIEGNDTVRADLPAYLLHPCLLDACFQSLLELVDPGDDRAFVPTHIRHVFVHQPAPAAVWCYGRVTQSEPDELTGDLSLCDHEGRVVAEIRGVRARALAQRNESSLRDRDDWLYALEWVRAESTAPEPTPSAGTWLVIEGDSEKANEVVAPALAGSGEQVIRVRPGQSFRTLSANLHEAEDTVEDYAALWKAVDPAQLAGIVIQCPDVDDEDITSLQTIMPVIRVIQSLIRLGVRELPRLTFVTRNAQPAGGSADRLNLAQSGIIGLLRTAANEYPEYRFRSIDVGPGTLPEALAGELRAGGEDEEIALRADGRYAMRMIRKPSASWETERRRELAIPECFGINVSPEGHCRLMEQPLGSSAEDRMRISVAAVPLGAHDITAPTQPDPSSDPARPYAFSTRLAVGKQTSSDAGDEWVAALTEVAPANLIDIPLADRLDLPAVETLAGRDLARITAGAIARFLLWDLGRIEPGGRVLIHAADHLLGSALVEAASALGADVTATVHDDAQADAVYARGARQVFGMDTLAFLDSVRGPAATAGYDVAINPVDGEVAAHTMALLKLGGRMLHFGHRPLVALPGRFVSTVDLDETLRRNKQAVASALRRLLADPPPARVGAAGSDEPAVEDFDEAVARLRAPGSSGWVTWRPAAQTNRDAFGVPPMEIRPDRTYLITGGFGGFGQAIAQRFADRGARHLVLLSRSGPSSASARHLVNTLRSRGVTLMLPEVDVSDPEAMQCVMTKVEQTMPRLAGVIHSAGVLVDGPINYAEESHFRRVFAPKVGGAWNLHQTTRHAELDFFVLFSSIGSMIGAAGQATYVAANVALDGLAAYRRARGLPAISISWGALSSVGMAARDADVDAYFERVGLKKISPAQAVRMLDETLRWHPVHIGINIMDWGRWGTHYPAWARSPRYAHLMPEITQECAAEEAWFDRWQGMSPEDQHAFVLERLIPLVAQTMKLPADRIASNDSLPQLGIDSLIAMELQIGIQNALGARVSTLELMKGSTLGQLAEQIGSSLRQPRSNPAWQTKIDPGLDPLSEDDIEDLLREVSTVV